MSKGHHSYKAKGPVEKFYMDSVAVNSRSVRGYNGFLLVTCAFSRYKWILLYRRKSDMPQMLIDLVKKLRNMFNRAPKVFHCDQGKEFQNSKLLNFAKEWGISWEFSHTYVPAQNGSAERANRTVLDGARTLLQSAKLLLGYWCFAAACKVFLLNRNLTNFKGDFILPYSKLFQKKPDVSILRVFGSRGLGKRGNPANRKKFSAKAEECLFLGYDEESPSYLVQWKDRCFGKTRSLKLKENELVSTNVEEFVPKSAFMSSQKSPEFSLWYELFSLSAVTGEDFLSKEVPRSYFDIPYTRNFKEWKKSYDL